MSDRPRRLYWDTSLFLCFLNKEEQERRRVCEHLLQRARAGEIEIYTSYWTVVEVIRPKWIPARIPLTEQQVELIQGMFQWEWLRKVQVHQTVAFAASDLARKFKLKPADAIHAATALAKKVDALQAFDRDFAAIATLVNVEEPKYLTEIPLIEAAEAEDSIGPTPKKIEAAAPQSVSVWTILFPTCRSSPFRNLPAT
jgi:predicted nucleic acid-binding protein